MAKSLDFGLDYLAERGDNMKRLAPPILLACQAFGELLLIAGRPFEAIILAQRLTPIAKGPACQGHRGLAAQFLRSACLWVKAAMDRLHGEMDRSLRDKVEGMAKAAVDMAEEEHNAGNPLVDSQVGR